MAKKAHTAKGKAASKRVAVKRVAAKRKTARPAPAARGSALVSVTPGFTVNDAEKSIAWYRDVLGFTVKERWEHEGRFLGAEIASGAVSLNLSQEDWKMGRDRIKGQGTRMYIITGPRIDELAGQIKARGGTLDQEPTDGWGVRAFSLKDPDGFNLTFMTPLKK
jgi:uncharacterized glyoxalase superfamily protein PhnB